MDGIDETPVHRVKMKLGELHGVRVKFLSLVERGANRAPFRLTKSDEPTGGDGVLDIGRIGKAKKAEPEVEVVAIAVSADADLAAVQAAAKEHGLPVEHQLEAEGGHVLTKSEDFKPAEGHVVIKLDQGVGLVLANAEGLLEVAKASFSENLGSAQFIPGMVMAEDALRATILEAIEDADGPDAKKRVKAALKDFAAYGSTLVDAIPEDVFKGVLKFEEALDSAGAEDAGVEGSKPAEPEGEVAKGDEAADDTAQDSDDEPGDTVEKSDEEPEGDDGEKSKDDKLDAVLQAVKGVTDAVAKQGEAIEALNGRVDEVARKAESADGKLKSIVGGSPTGDVPRFARKSTAKKSEDPWFGDTAYGRPKD